MHNRLKSILTTHDGCATIWIINLYFHHLEDITVNCNQSLTLYFGLFETWPKLISVNFLHSLLVIKFPIFFLLRFNHRPVRCAALVWGNRGLKRRIVCLPFHDLGWVQTVKAMSTFQDSWYIGQTSTSQRTLEFLPWCPCFVWAELSSWHCSTLPALERSSLTSPTSRPGPSRRRGSWAGCRPYLSGNTALSC